LLPEDTDTRGAKNESRVLRGTLTEPGLEELADEADLRFLLLVVEGLSGLAGGIANSTAGQTRSPVTMVGAKEMRTSGHASTARVLILQGIIFGNNLQQIMFGWRSTMHSM
jgi:hypothetical protein